MKALNEFAGTVLKLTATVATLTIPFAIAIGVAVLVFRWVAGLGCI